MHHCPNSLLYGAVRRLGVRPVATCIVRSERADVAAAVCDESDSLAHISFALAAVSFKTNLVYAYPYPCPQTPARNRTTARSMRTQLMFSSSTITIPSQRRRSHQFVQTYKRTNVRSPRHPSFTSSLFLCPNPTPQCTCFRSRPQQHNGGVRTAITWAIYHHSAVNSPFLHHTPHKPSSRSSHFTTQSLSLAASASASTGYAMLPCGSKSTHSNCCLQWRNNGNG